MANSLGTNPIHLDATSGGAWTGKKRVKLVQWIDDNADVADNDDLTFTVNGVTINVKVQKPSDVGHHNPVLYEAAFPNGMEWNDFTLTALDHGDLLIWL